MTQSIEKVHHLTSRKNNKRPMNVVFKYDILNTIKYLNFNFHLFP